MYAAKNAEILTCHEVKLTEISSLPGWSEFDGNAIWRSVLECIEISIKNLLILDINPADIVALGICNQRETTIMWDAKTGTPVYNVIASSDTRTGDILSRILSKTKNKINYLKEATGLPLSTCFSAIKIRWLIENVKEVREAIEKETCLFGTLDTWILWNLTGGTDSGVHATDVTNASRTMLMNIESLQWDARLTEFFAVPSKILPQIKSCSEIYGYVNAGLLTGVPIAAIMGDQQAALLGQLCVKAGTITCNYNEGCSLLFNTGQEVINSDNGLLSTVAFKLGPDADTYYALEGSAPCAGAAITWLNDTLMIPTQPSPHNNHSTLVHSVSDPQVINSTCVYSGVTYLNPLLNNNYRAPQMRICDDITFVPAFSGWYSPYWKYNTRGIIVGLTSQTKPQQIVYATYEAIAFQTRQFMESLQNDCKMWPPIERLLVGGDITVDNNFLLQLIADLCGLTIEKPQTTSPPCLGAMLAAGLAMKILTLDHFRTYCVPPVDVFQASIGDSQRDARFARWMKAVQKSLRLEQGKGEEIQINSSALLFQDKSNERPVSHSIPGTIFLFTSFTILLIAEMIQKN